MSDYTPKLPEVKFNKNGYELRTDILAMAKDMVQQEYSSKFAGWEGFANFKTGKIALQDHGENVWYRNIMIKEWNTMKITTGCENGM